MLEAAMTPPAIGKDAGQFFTEDLHMAAFSVVSNLSAANSRWRERPSSAIA